MTEKTLKKARGLNSIADPSDFRGSKGRKAVVSPDVVPLHREDRPQAVPEKENRQRDESPLQTVPTPHLNRVKAPNEKKTRRELSIPIPVADALEKTGINAADLTMAAYRKYSDEIYAGERGRMVSRGRVRLRLTMSGKDFDKIVRLGQNRGWNKSETVSVLLAAELLD